MSMPAAAASFPISYLQQATGCLGVCRHCYDLTAAPDACHQRLADLVLSLEIAILLLKENSRLAYDRLGHCAELCAAIAACAEQRCPRVGCRGSAAACSLFLGFWRSESAGLGQPLSGRRR